MYLYLNISVDNGSKTAEAKLQNVIANSSTDPKTEIIIDTGINKKDFPSIILFIAVLTSLVVQQLFFNIQGQLIILCAVTTMTVSYHYNWVDLAKALLGIIISYSSFILGYIVYMALPNESVERARVNDEPPPQRFDIFIFGTAFAIFFLFITLLYYYKLRESKNTKLEKYFSYLLLIGVTISLLLSFCFSL